MSIKYVEDYRKNTLTGGNFSDTVTIQNAVDDLIDGDTLIFNKREEVWDNETNELTGYDTTYVLDELHLLLAMMKYRVVYMIATIMLLISLIIKVKMSNYSINIGHRRQQKEILMNFG